MSSGTIQMTESLVHYLRSVGTQESSLLARLRDETAHDPMALMQISPEQGQLMAWLVSLTGAKRTLEVGVFTGYSSLVVALALPAEGRITACDVSEAWTAVARRYWEEAGVAEKIDLRLAPAIQTLDDLVREGASESYDFAFIDADKESYDAYYEACLKLVRSGGVIAVDNALWGGAVAEPENGSPSTQAIRALNLKVRDDARVTSSLIPIGDGLLVIRKS